MSLVDQYRYRHAALWLAGKKCRRVRRADAGARREAYERRAAEAMGRKT